MQNSIRSYAGVILLSVAVFFLYLRAPGVGDDFGYWQTAYGISEGVDGAYQTGSFHDLRWPIWGTCWLFYQITKNNLATFYGTPLLMLIAGALTAFCFARRILDRPLFAWLAVLFFLLHPLLDPVVSRPMPDLGEGVFAGLVLLTWLAGMQAEKRIARIGWAVLCGLLLAVAFANRFTGILILPMVLLVTLIFFPRRWHWGLLSIAFALMFIGLECLVYQGMTGDFFHTFHVNADAKGKKGTEEISLFYLPFRFLDTLWKANHLSPFLFLLMLPGGVFLWRKGGAYGRLVVAWGVLMYLAYSCALQQIWPPKPMLRDGTRFLATLVIPLSIMAAGGAIVLGGWLRKFPRFRGRTGVWLEGKPAVLFAVAALLACLITERDRFDLDYLPDFRKYVASRAPGTTVLTDRNMWYFSHLIAQKESARLDFKYQSGILNRDDETEQLATGADEFWFIRKLLVLNIRQDLSDGTPTAPESLSTFFESPQPVWRFAELIPRDEWAEFVFYQKKKAGEPDSVVLSGTAIPGIPALPLNWDGKSRKESLTFSLPDSLRGRRCRLKIRGAANTPQPVETDLELTNGRDRLFKYHLVPVFRPTESTDFFNFEIPLNATEATVVLNVNKKTRELRITELEIVID